MGGKGPAPKRSEQRRRANTPKTGAPTKARGHSRVPVPKPDPLWHPTARRWYNSLGRSGQAAFYEPSDWALAQLLADLMSRELNPQPIVVGKDEFAHVEMVPMAPKAASVAAWLKGMTALLVAEGDRRHVALELQRPPAPDTAPAPPAPTDLRSWRSNLAG